MLQIVIQSRKVGDLRLFSVFLINVEVDLGREMKGLVRRRHKCEQQLLPLAGMAATPEPLLLKPLMQPFARYCLVGLENDVISQTPGRTYIPITEERKAHGVKCLG